MSNSLARLNKSLQRLEDVIAVKLSPQAELSNKDENSLLQQLGDANTKLQQELATSKQEYQILKTTSQEVVNELNNSIQII